MEEIQSWWEVPAVAHFCYVFRSAFNLIFFEIAELESALLNIQDPDMSISLDQLIIRLLQGCLDEESVSEENWEEKLHELFNENCEDDEENPFDDSQNYFQLTPRSKIKILMRLCEFRLDVEGALDDIKSIPSEDMQAKCMGKDSLNNTYWYFCDERLYKEDSSSGKKLNQNQKKKEVKNSVSKNNKLVNTREKRTKSNSDVDKSWTIACFNASDWEKLLKRFSKSKSTQEKELAKVIQNHLPIVQERVSEKDRLLRKRFMELAPKRTSSRISKVQAKKRMEELKAREEAMIAKLEAEKEQARKEALRLKEEKESRQKRAEMRHQAVEERARRAQIREIARSTKSEDSGSSNDSSSEYEEKQNHSVRPKIQRNQRARVEHSDESEASDSEEEEEDSGSDYGTSNAYPKRTRRKKEFSKNRSVRPKVQKRQQVEHSDESEASNSEEADSGSDYETSIAYHQRTRKGKELKQDTYDSRKLTQPDDNKRVVRTYSNYREQARKNEARSSSRLQGKQQTVKYRFDTDESEQSSDSSSEHEEKQNYSARPKIQRNQHTRVEHSDESEASDSEAEEASGSDYVTSIAYPERTRRKKEFNENHSVRSKVQKNRQALIEHSESPMETRENRPSTKLRQNRLKSEDKSESDGDESDDKNDNSSSDESVSDTEKDKTHNNVKTEYSVSMQDNSKTSSTSNSNKSQGSSLSLPRVTLYKTTLLKDSSDASKWNAVLDSKGQKLHILNGSCDNLSSKKPKLEEEKIFRTSTPNMKSSLLKENHIYQPVRQTPFITYGKIIPSSPSIVRLDFRKPQPPNHKVSS